MDDTIKKEVEALNGDYNGMTADSGNTQYEVKGWYCDSNGCLKTYGDGYNESFISDTNYS